MRKLTGREKRLAVYLAILLGLIGFDQYYRRWSPKVIRETPHHLLYSSATPAQTEAVAAVAELTWGAYGEIATNLGFTLAPEGKCKVKLFQDRAEFRRVCRVLDWAEGYYQKPYCHQYFPADELNPFHWFTHEATHQFNTEVAHLDLPKWLEEGIADYVGTSQIHSNRIALGEIDVNTYPVWWSHLIAASGDLATDRTNQSLIPLHFIIAGKGGPPLNDYVNLYYLHWWSLTHFLMSAEDGKHRAGLRRLIATGGGLEAFEKEIGPLAAMEPAWYQHVLRLKGIISRSATPPVRFPFSSSPGATNK